MPLSCAVQNALAMAKKVCERGDTIFLTVVLPGVL